MSNDHRSAEAADLLLANARDFLNGGLSMLFARKVTSREAKIAAVSIQTGVELFAKFRVVKELGLKELVLRGNVPGGDLRKAAGAGHFRTLGYDQLIEKLELLEPLDEWQAELMTKLQKLRNTLVHFAGDLDVAATRTTISALLVKVLAMFAKGEGRDEGEMLTYAEFLDADNFSSLTGDASFRAEAFDAATADIMADEIVRCWLCEQDTLTIRPTDAYFCWTCGLSAELGAASYADCATCRSSKSVVYDPLNENDGFHHGKCLVCDEWRQVACAD